MSSRYLTDRCQLIYQMEYIFSIFSKRNKIGILHVYLPFIIMYQNFLVLWFICSKTMTIFCVYHNVEVMANLSGSIFNTQVIVYVLCISTATDGFEWPGILSVALNRFPFGKVIHLHQAGSGMHTICGRSFHLDPIIMV